MSRYKINPSGRERTFADDEIIVSKTDIRGRLTYVNDVFIKVSGFEERELLGEPHSIIRHPEMPRCVFKLLWETIQSGREIFAFINNLAINGDNYWVLAHVTPCFDTENKIVGYHSNRRVPPLAAFQTIKPLYQRLLSEERRHSDRKAGLTASYTMFMDAVRHSGHSSYDRMIFAISTTTGTQAGTKK